MQPADARGDHECAGWRATVKKLLLLCCMWAISLFEFNNKEALARRAQEQLRMVKVRNTRRVPQRV
jgi:hypothetical protein